MIRSLRAYLVVSALALSVVAMPAFAEETKTDTTTPPPAFESAQPSQPADQTDQPKAEKRRLTLLPAYNLYFPTDSKTKSRFGDNWSSFGLAVAWQTKNVDPKKFELRLDGVAEDSNTTSARIFPVGVGYTTRLASANNMTAYTGVSANLYISKIESVLDNVDTGWNLKVGAGALVGVNLGKSFNIQGSYYLIPEIGGLQFSGFNLSAHVRLIQF